MKRLSLVTVLLIAFGFAKAQSDTVFLDGGIKMVVLETGKGFKPNIGDKVWVSYVGKFASNGKEFDNSEGYPIDFVIGKKEVIKGWEEVVQHMQKGTKIWVYIPSELAYGEKGYPMSEDEGVAIPPNADLIFEMELKKFKAAK